MNQMGGWLWWQWRSRRRRRRVFSMFPIQLRHKHLANSTPTHIRPFQTSRGLSLDPTKERERGERVSIPRQTRSCNNLMQRSGFRTSFPNYSSVGESCRPILLIDDHIPPSRLPKWLLLWFIPRPGWKQLQRLSLPHSPRTVVPHSPVQSAA